MSVEIEIDAGRVLFGLSRIGYTTSSALCDIIDNSVRAEANNIHLLIVKDREELSDSRKDNIKEYLVIDDGKGMNEEQLKEAIKLGSSSEDYEGESLAKFGLGLKSASFSQADLLKIISSDGNNEFKKLVVSLPDVIESKVYRANEEEITEEEEQLIANYLPNGKGTIVKVANVRKDNHPSLNQTLDDLKSKIGVIYYYFLKDGLKIYINEDSIEQVDPLFTDEAVVNGNLNENEWDGKSVKWIEKPSTITLDDEREINVEIEITQLPYPPIFKIENPGEGKDAEIRGRYNIGANNYGFYVYRNKRLISWADRLNGIIPYDQDYYAFRGRIMISSNADDFFNIDVKKSVITLSEEAWNAVSDYTVEAKSKSKSAWQQAGQLVKDIVNREPQALSNEIASQFDRVEYLPGDLEISDDLLVERIGRIKQDMQSKITTIVRLFKEEKDEDVPTDYEPIEEEIEEAIKGEVNENLKKIFRVLTVEDNLLWEPYYDSDLNECVRINKLHRFARIIYSDNKKNSDLQILFDLILLQLAEAEVYTYKMMSDNEYDVIKSILTEFRRVASEFLANLARRQQESLPPYSDY
ncbi:MAG: ATP-binding protein [Balneola sp.]